ncbi:hypothetical protein M408DRAFT_111710 [Serendipita vermifera MAFF 305830]|uniref:Uncharacterized protein n=1 Tax=Serendipita vermifera MAFF 305830 TaxID=933852 RepID=A0A0C3AP59_SERVB|nr:hypothetical protein M408DRAFT_111710 [Serendipita vermifera MAFF 305830]
MFDAQDEITSLWRYFEQLSKELRMSVELCGLECSECGSICLKNKRHGGNHDCEFSLRTKHTVQSCLFVLDSVWRCRETIGSSSTPVTHSFSEGPEAVYYASPSTSSMARGDLSQAGLPATSMPSSSPETQVSPNDGHSGAPSTSKGDPVKVPRPKGYPTENNSRIRCILSGHTCVHFVLPVSNIQPGCSGT